MSEKEQKNTCILCGKEFKGYGNNPAPLKNECNLKKVILHYNDKLKLSYKYDAENGYIVKDAKKYFRSEKIKNYFDFYLSDTFLDRDRFTEKIEILD